MSAEKKNIAVEARRLKKTFRIGFGRKVVEAVKDVSFQVEEGETFGFLGPNGAGKTTSIKMLMSLISPDAGEMKIFGMNSRDPQARRGVGFLPEHPYFYDYLNPMEFLTYIGRLHGMGGSALKKEANELLDRVGLSHAKDRVLRKFSKGMLQRTGVAQAFLGNPRLVVLDEPLSGLDPIGRKEIKSVLADAKSRGITLFFSSHILSDIEMLCDRVVIVHHGNVVLEGHMDTILKKGSRRVELEVQGEPEKLAAIAHIPYERKEAPNGMLKLATEAELGPDLCHALVQAGCRIHSMMPVHATLEDVFLKAAGAKK